MLFTELPLEITSHILADAIAVHPTPSHILAVSAGFYAEALPLLYKRLRFNSIDTLDKFIASSRSIRPGTRRDATHPTLSRVKSTLDRGNVDHVEVSLPGGMASRVLWSLLREIFVECRGFRPQSEPTPAATDHSPESEPEPAPLQSVKFTLNSLASDPNLSALSNALKCINPRVFSWSGPDPDHNFSCAIVPAATDELFARGRALMNWTRLTSLTLSAISFSRCLGGSLLLLTPFTHPALKQIILRQVVFLHPAAIAALALGHPSLELIHCIDAFQESIYEPPVRVRDIEEALRTNDSPQATQFNFHLHPNAPNAVPAFSSDRAAAIEALRLRLRELGVLEGLGRVRRIVKCEVARVWTPGGEEAVA